MGEMLLGRYVGKGAQGDMGKSPWRSLKGEDLGKIHRKEVLGRHTGERLLGKHVRRGFLGEIL